MLSINSLLYGNLTNILLIHSLYAESPLIHYDNSVFLVHLFKMGLSIDLIHSYPMSLSIEADSLIFFDTIFKRGSL